MRSNSSMSCCVARSNSLTSRYVARSNSRSDLARDLKDLEYRMTIKLGSMMVVAGGAMATLVKPL